MSPPNPMQLTLSDGIDAPYLVIYDQIDSFLKTGMISEDFKADDAPWIDLAVRQQVIRSSDLNVLTKLLGLVVELQNRNVLDDTALLAIVETAMDTTPLDTCKLLFDHIESNYMATITKGLNPTRGKGLILLRVCNELLRRFSKTRDALYCGRIRLLLANVFPLSERSGLNLKGSFNTENVTEWDREATDDFYVSFWRCQEFFSNPPYALTDENNFSDVTKLLDKVLDRLGAVVDERSKFKVSESGDSQENEDGDIYFAKFLTSPTLLNLQMEDALFQKTFLLQVLLFLRYIKSQVQKLMKDESVKFPAKEHREWIETARAKARSILAKTGFNDSFSSWLRVLFQRDDFWIQWKVKGCPKFELDSTSLDAAKEPLKPVKPFLPKAFLGDSELSRLWKIGEQPLDNATALKVPSLEEFLEPLKEQLDPENQIDEEYRLSRELAYVWRVGRLMVKYGTPVDTKLVVHDARLDVEKLVQIMDGTTESPIAVAMDVDEGTAAMDTTHQSAIESV